MPSNWIPEIEVKSPGELACHRCSGPLALTARMPYSFTRADGQVVSGQRTVGLCVRCDRDDMAAQGVLAFFTVYEKITEGTVRAVGPVLMEWIHHLTAHPPGCPDTDLDEEIRRWQAGEL